MANNNIIDDILHSVDIVDVINRYVPLKRAGSNFSGCCPFHNEKTPSFMVSPQKQIFKCFGCGVGGNVFSFVQEIEKIDFRDAVKILAQQNNIDMSKYETNFKSMDYAADEKEKIKRMHKIAQQFFSDNLKANETAQDYLKNQRHLSSETIKEFEIGFAPEKHYELLQLLRNKGFSDTDILQASLAKKSANGDIYAFFRNRITFPIFDTMKNIVGFSARVIDPNDSPKYLNSAEHKAFEKSKILYGLSHAKSHIRQFQKLIIVEGQMDVIGLYRLEFPIGVATSGTALSDDHIKILKRYTENLFFLFDNDEAGTQATIRALKLCYQQNLFPKIVQLPKEAKDVDELANEENGKQIFESALENATDGFSTIYQRLQKKSDLSSPIDKQKIINTMFELILCVDNLTIQEHYKMLLAEKTGFPFEVLDAQFKKFKSQEGRLQINQMQRKQEQEVTAKYQPEREIIFSSLFYQDFLSKIIPNEETETQLLSLGAIFSVALPESLISKTLSQTLTPEENLKSEEMQLRRESQLGEISDIPKRCQIIKKAITQALQSYIQQAQKSSNISDEEKKEISQLKLKLMK